MITDAEEQGLRATEIAAWARLNETALRQRNAKILYDQWEEMNHRLKDMEGNDLPKMMWRMGGFDATNTDSEFNLDRMVKMQDEAAERD
ncbi:MAG: hypothetical protein GY847_19045 [Proteobacteria bacterium]|nr:hypothetical protein [Pseudomonadota bacterium]